MRRVGIIVASAAAAACYGHDNWGALSNLDPFVQQQTAATADGAQLSLAIQLPSAPRQGDTLVLHEIQIGQEDPINIDGGGATWTPLAKSCQHLCTDVWIG